MIFYPRNVYKYNNDKGENSFFVYIGESDASRIIYGGEINTPDSNRNYLPIDGLDNLVCFTDKLIAIDLDNVTGQLFIAGEQIIIPPADYNALIIAICRNMIDNYSASIINELNQNYDSTNNILNDITFPEKLIRLLNWNKEKKHLKFDRLNFVNVILKFNIYYAYYGTNIGSEMEKLRPVIIWKQHKCKEKVSDSSYFVFPISSKKKKKNYAFYVPIMINGKENYVRINDGKRISIRRIYKPLIDESTRKTAVLTQNEIDEIKKAILNYFSLGYSSKDDNKDDNN